MHRPHQGEKLPLCGRKVQARGAWTQTFLAEQSQLGFRPNRIPPKFCSDHQMSLEHVLPHPLIPLPLVQQSGNIWC